MKVPSACRTTCTFNVSLTRPPSTSRLTSEIKVPNIRPSIFLFFLLFGFLFSFFIFWFVRYSYGTTLVMNNAYYVTLGNANTFLSTFRVQMFDVPKGETIRFAFPYLFILKKLKRRIRRIWWKTRVPNGAAVAVKTGGYNGDQNLAVQVIIFLRIFFIILFLFFYIFIYISTSSPPPPLIWLWIGQQLFATRN